MKPAAWLPMIEGMLEAVWVVDPIDLRIVATNRAAESLLGAEPGSLVGRPVIDLAATPEDVFFWEDVAAGLQDRILSDTLLRRGDGGVVEVERRVSRVLLAEGSTVYVVGIRDRSEERRVEGELEKLVAELRATLESAADGILVTTLDGGIRGYNQRFADLWNLPTELMTRRDDAGVHGWMGQSVVKPAEYATRLAAIAHAPLLEATDIIVLRSGKVLERVTLPQYARGRPIGRVYSFRDITQRLADEERLRVAAKVFEASLDAIFVTDAEHRIVAANPSCARLTGHEPAALIGRNTTDLICEPGESGALPAHIVAQLERERTWEGELRHRRADGSSAPCLLAMVRIADEQGATKNFIGFFKDLTGTIAAQQRIEELAYTDALTGLPNRLLLGERIAFALGFARREGFPFAILFIDLDRFKHINDSLGHMFGDRVLVEVARRIKQCVREVDTVARLGGDEFVLLLNKANAHGAETMARRVIEALDKPITLDDMTFTVTCSIGIALYPDDGATMDDLIKNADSAMYHVKERGRAGFGFYQRQMNVGLLSRMKLDHAMREALATGGFRLHYQPQVDLRSGHIFGVEALLRWHDPTLGAIGPGQFIPVAEETGVIVPIGHWVVAEAIRQAVAWRSAGLALTMSINVSALQFQQADFVESIARALEAGGLPPDALDLELTETILIRDAKDALTRLEALAHLGVRLAIDDFGTGYSSLSYLKRFPIRKLKIDRSFIDQLPDDESDVAIVGAIINLARSLGLRVIAEGVETDVQRRFLVSAGCDEFQGFLCAAPLGPEDLERLVRTVGWVAEPGHFRLVPPG